MIFPNATIKNEDGPFRNTGEYQEKPECVSIPDEQELWRYMDYYKFKSLLESKALFFSRVDKLSDKFEGTWARTNLEIKIFVSDAKRGPNEYNADRKILHEAAEDTLRLFYVYCFTIRNSESKEMWDAYTNNSESIAIQTNFLNLKTCFTKDPAANRVFTEIYASKIRYLEDENAVMEEWSILFPVLYKRKQFAYEKELRLFTTYEGIELAARLISVEDLKKSGKDSIADFLGLEDLPAYPSLLFSINPEILIEKIVVHPNATDEFLDKVKNLVRKSGINIEPSRSTVEMR
jgi:hypothetical protein